MAYLLAAFALGCGLAGGSVNILLLERAGARLGDEGSQKAFVLSSFLRVMVFAILAGAFAALAPWWAMVLYLIGLFTPFAWYVIGMSRKR